MLTGSHVEAVEAWWKLLRVDVDTKGCYMAATQQNSKYKCILCSLQQLSTTCIGDTDENKEMKHT